MSLSMQSSSNIAGDKSHSLAQQLEQSSKAASVILNPTPDDNLNKEEVDNTNTDNKIIHHKTISKSMGDVVDVNVKDTDLCSYKANNKNSTISTPDLSTRQKVNVLKVLSEAESLELDFIDGVKYHETGENINTDGGKQCGIGNPPMEGNKEDNDKGSSSADKNDEDTSDSITNGVRVGFQIPFDGLEDHVATGVSILCVLKKLSLKYIN